LDYRTLFGACAGLVLFAACGSDETTPSGTTSDGGGASGSSTGGAATGGGGAKNSGGSNAGGSNAGGSNAGGSNAGGASAGGAPIDGGDSSTAGSGGTAAGGAGGRAAGGGTATGGAPPDGGDGGTACSTLSACCSGLTGPRQGACNRIASAGDQVNCASVTDVFCVDGGGVVGPGGDAFVDCGALQTCCNALADGGRPANNCNRVVGVGDDALCNQASTRFCN